VLVVALSRRALLPLQWSLVSLSLSTRRSCIETLIFSHSNHHCALVPWLIDIFHACVLISEIAFKGPKYKIDHESRAKRQKVSSRVHLLGSRLLAFNFFFVFCLDNSCFE
ncbi:hypothetical protein V8G54_002146, partial [Vigna mungo]